MLSFKKKKKGSRVGELAVYYNIMSATNTLSQSKTPVWSMKNSHGNHWNLAHVQYEGGNQSINNFIIEAYAGYSSSGKFSTNLSN